MGFSYLWDPDQVAWEWGVPVQRKSLPEGVSSLYIERPSFILVEQELSRPEHRCAVAEGLAHHHLLRCFCDFTARDAQLWACIQLLSGSRPLGTAEEVAEEFDITVDFAELYLNQRNAELHGEAALRRCDRKRATEHLRKVLGPISQTGFKVAGFNVSSIVPY